MSFQRYLFVCSIVAGLAGAATAQPTITGPLTTASVTRDYYFPPLTLTSSETARVIVVNTAPAATNNEPAPSCAGTISFLGSGTNQPSVTLNFTIGAGKFASLDLPYGSSGITTTPPGEIVGKVETTTSVPPAAPCALQMSLVVFDTTSGVGHLVLSNATVQAGPVTIPIFGVR